MIFENRHIHGEAAYNDFPYLPLPHYRSHPAHVAALAHWHGVDVPDVRSARVLELGCAGGENLIPHAFFYPEGRFVGVDYSREQVADATKHIRDLRLTNVDVLYRNIADITPADGTFDIIIAHGTYSWIPEDVQAHLLRVAAENLADNGVVYISYNVLPGWYAKRVVRDLMMFHTMDMTSQVERVRSARALLGELKGTISGSYGVSNDAVIGYVEKSLDYYIAHEYLEADNHQCYFSEFVERAAACGLTWITDTNPALNLPDDARSVLDQRTKRFGGDNPIRIEQYLDFLIGRVFRMSILAKTRNASQRSYAPVTERARQLHFHTTGSIQRRSDPTSPLAFEYASANGGYTFRTSDPLTVVALEHIQRLRHKTFAIDELAMEMANKTDGESLRNRLAALLQQLWQHHIVFPYSHEIRWESVSEKPQAWELARLDARAGRRHTTNVLHEPLEFSQPGSREFLMLVDGTRTHDELVEEVSRLGSEGVIHFDGVIPADNLHHARAYVEQKLAVYAANEALAPSTAA